VQISEWQAFGEIYPYGEIRQDYRAAMTAFEIRQSIRGKAKFADFLLPEMTEEDDRNKRFLEKMRRAIERANK